MAKTNFAALTDEQKLVWSRDLWHQARENSFITRFMGTGKNSLIQRITELTKTERGDKAIITLVPDIEGDGVVGDYDLEGNEEALKAYDDHIQIDQLRHAHRTTGKMADQRSIVNFRTEAKDQLAYWLADRIDQMAFLTMAGMGYGVYNNGKTRPVKAAGQNLSDLAFAADVAAPSSERHVRIAGTGLEQGDTSVITAADKIGYRHIVQMQALAKERYIRGVRGTGGAEMYHLFLNPLAMAQLKLDADFIANSRHAGVRGEKNSLWAGGDSFQIDGVMVHEFRHVPHNKLAAAKWGAGSNVAGTRALFCGAQALGVADLGSGEWFEKEFDYNNQKGISYGKIFGMKKPQFKGAKESADGNVKQDYGVIAVDFAL
ncbi:N4-gp56 family major capsid protein [Oceanisphaera litoralis]|uniref:N4-gp56 family major capsid protein n=1 Tax=Oceanisphaera litoralis TaxID=225144 RepID=UPI00195AE3C1|nr:N4-gp56 family major capsid protein [Oceanisphaera litoralis]MBM7454469.1 N4-gp56 family major capsid protein [Oceanisphaera litoralis]